MKKSILFITLFAKISTGFCQWIELGGDNSLQINNEIFSITSNTKGDIYVSGKFTNGQGECYVAIYNGANWTQTSGIKNSSAFNPIYDIGIDSSGSLYACGGFKNDNGNYYVAKYNGTNWSEVGGSNSLKANNSIHRILFDKKQRLIISGQFKNSNNQTYVSVFESNLWAELPATNPLRNSSAIVALIKDDQGNLFAAGHVEQTSANNVYKYNGTNWINMGNPCSVSNGAGDIYSLAVDSKGIIYAGGHYQNSSGKRFVSIFNGTNWTELGGNNSLKANNTINCIIVDKSDNLYVAGAFSVDSTNYYNCQVKKYTGTSWDTLGVLHFSNQNSLVQSIEKLHFDKNGYLYAIGNFWKEGTRTYVAKYTKAISSISNDFDEAFGLYPNPCSNCYVNINNKLDKNNLYVTNIFGRRIKTLFENTNNAYLIRFIDETQKGVFFLINQKENKTIKFIKE